MPHAELGTKIFCQGIFIFLSIFQVYELHNKSLLQGSKLRFMQVMPVIFIFPYCCISELL